MINQPIPSDPNWPRYSSREFPSYRFVRGTNPHPRRDPAGHSYGQPESKPPAFAPHRWKESEAYLYGVDLYNFAYWWECHEVFEGLWHAMGHETQQGRFLQGLIQVAAANIKRLGRVHPAADNLARRGLAHFQDLPAAYMGIDVRDFAAQVLAYSEGLRDTPPLILLHVEQNPARPQTR